MLKETNNLNPTLWWLLPFIITMGLWNFWLASQTFVPDFDTGTTALMVQHILDGQRPLFFYGQNYMGSLEAYVAAGICQLFGYNALSLAASPILFSLAWLIGTLFLLRACHITRGLFLVALLFASPGWLTERYMIATYGGYPALLALGTWSLWAAVRSTSAQRHSKTAWLILWGFLAALALWTHFLVAPFLLAGGLFMLWHHRQNLLAFSPFFALGCIIAIKGLLPRLLTHHIFVSNLTTDSSFQLTHLAKSLNALWHDNLPLLLFKGHLNEITPTPWQPYAQAALILMILIAAWNTQKTAPKLALVTAFFTLTFLALYLPHTMSTLKAPRYLIPLAGILLPLTAVGWATLPHPILRRSGCTLLLLAVIYQTQSILHYKKREAPRASEEIKIRDRLTHNTRKANVTHSAILGGLELRHRGQALTAHAKENPIFTNIRDERYLPYTQAFLNAPHYGYTYQQINATRIANTLRALNTTWQNTTKNRLLTLHNITPKNLYPNTQTQRLMPPEIQTHPALNDNTLHTTLTPTTNNHWTIELHFKRSINLAKLWLMNARELQETIPDTYAIEGHSETHNWFQLAPPRLRLPQAEVIGNRLYIDTYYSRTEHRFTGQKINALRITFTNIQPQHAISECWIFEKTPPTTNNNKSQAHMRNWFKKQGINTVWADTWVSTQLQQHTTLKTLPPYNPKFNSTNQKRNFIPTKTLGLVIEQNLEKTIDTLLSHHTINNKQNFGPYTAYTFQPQNSKNPPPLYWDGRTLLHR